MALRRLRVAHGSTYPSWGSSGPGCVPPTAGKSLNDFSWDYSTWYSGVILFKETIEPEKQSNFQLLGPGGCEVY